MFRRVGLCESIAAKTVAACAGAREKGLVVKARRSAAVLTRTEERVLALVSQSMTNREIASTLGISPPTVKRPWKNILRKLGLRNRLEAAIYGLSMSCHGDKDGDCPLAAWRRRHELREDHV